MASIKRITRRAAAEMPPIDGEPMEKYFSLLRDNSGSTDGYTERDYRQHITSVARRMRGRPQTEEEERGAIRDYITATFGEADLRAAAEAKGKREEAEAKGEVLDEEEAPARKKLSNTTRNRRLTYLRTYTAWLVQEGYRSEAYNPTDGLKRKKEQERPRTFEAKAVADLIEALKKEATTAGTWDSLRNAVIVMTMALCGLRKCEIRTLKPGNVSLKDRRVFVHSPKTDMTRTVGIPETLAPWLKDLLEEREALVKEGKFVAAKHGEAALFCGPRGKALSEAGLSHAWQREGRQHAPEGARMYDLRHFFGTTLGEAGAGGAALNAKEIMTAMGHSDVRTSMKYTHPDPEKVAAAAGEKMGNVLSACLADENKKGKGQQAKTGARRGRTLVQRFEESGVHKPSAL